MNRACEAPFWSETAQGKDERSGHRANADDPKNTNPIAKMIETNFIQRLPALLRTIARHRDKT
jgi:hypothetical protein